LRERERYRESRERKSWRKKRRASERAKKRNRSGGDGKKGKMYVVDRLNHKPGPSPCQKFSMGPVLPLFSPLIFLGWD